MYPTICMLIWLPKEPSLETAITCICVLLLCSLVARLLKFFKGHSVMLWNSEADVTRGGWIRSVHEYDLTRVGQSWGQKEIPRTAIRHGPLLLIQMNWGLLFTRTSRCQATSVNCSYVLAVLAILFADSNVLYLYYQQRLESFFCALWRVRQINHHVVLVFHQHSMAVTKLPLKLQSLTNPG